MLIICWNLEIYWEIYIIWRYILQSISPVFKNSDNYKCNSHFLLLDSACPNGLSESWDNIQREVAQLTAPGGLPGRRSLTAVTLRASVIKEGHSCHLARLCALATPPKESTCSSGKWTHALLFPKCYQHQHMRTLTRRKFWHVLNWITEAEEWQKETGLPVC